VCVCVIFGAIYAITKVFQYVICKQNDIFNVFVNFIDFFSAHVHMRQIQIHRHIAHAPNECERVPVTVAITVAHKLLLFLTNLILYF